MSTHDRPAHGQGSPTVSELRKAAAITEQGIAAVRAIKSYPLKKGGTPYLVKCRKTTLNSRWIPGIVWRMTQANGFFTLTAKLFNRIWIVIRRKLDKSFLHGAKIIYVVICN